MCGCGERNCTGAMRHEPIAISTRDITGRQIHVASTTSLTTHCIVLPGPEGDYPRALAALKSQTEPVDAITAIGEPSAVELFSALPSIRWMAPANDNQLSALNTALTSNSSGLLFFLRTGDLWMPDHLAQMRAVYAHQPEFDFVFCDFLSSDDQAAKANVAADRVDLGFSAISTYLDLDFVGGPLSCLSMRRTTLERIIPLVDDPDWQAQPEAHLVVAASLAGARKCHLRRPLVRIAPGSPTLSDHRQRLESDFDYRLKTLRLVSKLARHMQFDPEYVRQLVAMEYESQTADDWPLFVKYCRYVQTQQSDSFSRQRILLSMYRRIKRYVRKRSPLTGRFRSWWLKQRLSYGGKLVA